MLALWFWKKKKVKHNSVRWLVLVSSWRGRDQLKGFLEFFQFFFIHFISFVRNYLNVEYKLNIYKCVHKTCKFHSFKTHGRLTTGVSFWVRSSYTEDTYFYTSSLLHNLKLSIIEHTYHNRPCLGKFHV